MSDPPFAPSPAAALLHSAFEAQARLAPRRTAVRLAGRSLTYGQLARRAHALATELHARGVRPGAIVGVCATRSPESVTALLAILKAGAAYLPLEVAGPPARSAAILVDSGPLLVLADAAGRAHLGTAAAPGAVLALGRPAPASATPSPLPAAAVPHPDDLAYVIYTSGSTGTPKGVMCTHCAIVNRLDWMQRRYALRPADRVLHKTAADFDVSLWELLWPLRAGARLVLAPPGEQRHPELLAHTIGAQGVTVLHFVPAMLGAFIAAGQLERCRRLRAVVCSGEALPGELRDLFLACSGAQLHNLYGPTEASIDVTHHTCRRTETAATVPIGRAIDGVRTSVLDARLDPVPAGRAGEICIAGVALARGYLGSPRRTAERFRPDPCGNGTRLYRSGDRGRLRADGAIEFLGRLDRQVKIRGVRIELGEVEAVLGACAGVERCAVSAGEGARLTAYIVGGAPPAHLRAELAGRLPAQAVPARFVYLRSLPVLTSGKLDHGALRALERRAAPVSRATGGLRSQRAPFERAIAEIWQAVLGVEHVGAHDNFFALGGDSIRSIEVAVRARAAGLALTTADVFQHQTPHALALHAHALRPAGVRAKRRATAPFALLGERDRARMPGGVCDAMPLSSLLATLLAHSLESPRYLAYATSLELAGPYRPRALDSSLKALVARHPALRTAVELQRFSEPLQLVYERASATVRELDARGLPHATRQASLAVWLAEERTRRFDWAKPPLLRLTVHRLEVARWRLTLVEPFLDGWSATLVLAELLSLYRAQLCGEQPRRRDAPRTGSRDVLAAERASLRSPAHRAFWKAHLAGAPATRLPRLAPNAAGGERQLRVPVAIGAPLTRCLLERARSLGVPLKSVLLAAHAWVLAALTNQREIVCGLTVGARPEQAGGAHAVGLFLNTLPMRLAVDRGPWSQLIHDAHRAEALVLPWRHYPYAQLARDCARPALLDSVFNFTHFRPYTALARPDAGAVRLLDVEGWDQTYFPLTAQFSLHPAREQLAVTLELDPDGFAAPQLEQLRDLHAHALDAIVADPSASHHLAGALTTHERARRARWSSPQPRPAPEGPARLEQLFERRACATPHAPAVFDDRERLTYGVLADRARRLAQRIHARSPDAPKRIGVCVARSPALVEAVLAALLAGAAFVPLDTALAPARLRALLDDAAPDLVLADAHGAEALDGAGGANCLQLGGVCALGSCGPGSLPPARTGGPDDVAHIVYTSGSTGRPRGVLCTHCGLVNRLRWMWRAHPFRPGEVACVRGPIGFVDSVTEIFSGLLCGSPTYLLPEEVCEPGRVAAALTAAGVTRMTIVPALLRELLAACATAERRAALARIEHWTLSGEPLDAGLLAQLREAAPRATILNLYGSSEVAGDVTAHVCAPGERDPVPAGVPIDGARVRVLDVHGRDAPFGTVGEIAVEGPPLALGYLNDPRLTAERFRPSPHGRAQRLFRTGDLGRHTPAGILQTLGRRDRQLKLNGVRVEPAEVEAALLAHPAVRACAVLAAPAPAPALAPALVAHVEAHPGGDVDGVQLRSFLRARLPSAMVPGQVLVVSALPRNANGKLDRGRLAALVSRPRGGGERGVPRTPLERTILELAATELGLPRATLHDDFFARGGDSLAAVRLLARLRERFPVRLALREIFDRPRLGDLCAYLELALAREGSGRAEGGRGGRGEY